jgi:hypothetical protein
VITNRTTKKFPGASSCHVTLDRTKKIESMTFPKPLGRNYVSSYRLIIWLFSGIIRWMQRVLSGAVTNKVAKM